MKKYSKRLAVEADRITAALKRAAHNAQVLAESTGTPFIVMRRGKPVNLNPVKRRTKKQQDLLNTILHLR